MDELSLGTLVNVMVLFDDLQVGAPSRQRLLQLVLGQVLVANLLELEPANLTFEIIDRLIYI